jgi:hypothetical protein
MALFKKKNQQTDEINSVKDQGAELKQLVLKELTEKFPNGTLYDDCIIMPRGFTIDVQVGRYEERDEVKLLSMIYIVKHDDFDEPLIDPVDSQGKTFEEAAKMSVEIFFGGVWHPLDQSITKKNPIHISVNYLMQHYDFDMYAQSIVRIGVKDKQPTMLVNYIKAELPKYLGSKKYYWVRIYLAKMKEKKIIEVRVNGSVCSELSKPLSQYIDTWEETESFVSEKQYAIFVQREDDQCPFKKDTVVQAAQKAIEMMANINSKEDYDEMTKAVEEITGDKDLAAEVRIFIPEILAKLTLGYKEGDSLFLLEDDSSIEFKKTQLRSYFYIQQALLEFLSKNPPEEHVKRIVTNSVAFRELRKAHDKGHQPSELYVPGTSYKINHEGYKVW